MVLACRRERTNQPTPPWRLNPKRLGLLTMWTRSQLLLGHRRRGGEVSCGPRTLVHNVIVLNQNTSSLASRKLNSGLFPKPCPLSDFSVSVSCNITITQLKILETISDSFPLSSQSNVFSSSSKLCILLQNASCVSVSAFINSQGS